MSNGLNAARRAPKLSARQSTKRAKEMWDITQNMGKIARAIIKDMNVIVDLAKPSRIPMTPAQRRLNKIHAIASKYKKDAAIDQDAEPIPQVEPTTGGVAPDMTPQHST